MADDSKKTPPTSGTSKADDKDGVKNAAKPPTSPSTTPSGSTPTGSTSAGSTSTGPTAGSKFTAGGAAASSAQGASSAKETNASTARPITSTPAYGDPTVDRLSLEPADSDDWVTRTKLWVEENPALAIVGAVGLGLLVGRIVTAAIPDPEPKTLTGKIEKRAKELSKQGRHYADDAGDEIGKQLAVAAEALGVAAAAVSKNAKHGYDEAKDFSEHIAEAIGDAFSKKASQWLDRIS
jgi:ElaB/YqjD/DUF883 family membrane-anchored ribosome-binding protein